LGAPGAARLSGALLRLRAGARHRHQAERTSCRVQAQARQARHGRRPATQIDLSPTALPSKKELEVLVGSLKDDAWRLSHLYSIRNKDGAKVTFVPTWGQQTLIDDLGYRNLVLKGRQIHITTGYCLLWLDMALFTENLKIGIIANTMPNATKIFREKIKYPYENLPPWLKPLIPASKITETEIIFANGSEISVSPTFRSGNLQVLHVTEYGDICYRRPAAAEEVKTGGFPAVPANGVIVVESTAKGRGNDFEKMCTEAQKGSEWRFNFLPWWKHPEYAYKPLPGEEAQAFAERRDPEGEYLDKLEMQINLKLTKEQRRWWCNKFREQGDKIYSEYPSTPEEAFKSVTEGAYYGKLMIEAWRTGRVTKVPIEPMLNTETWWDIGMNDATAIWFVQRHGLEIRCVDYYENSGEGLKHYVNYLQDWATKHKGRLGRAIGPHDLEVREWTGGGETRKQAAAKLGLQFEIAPKLPPADGIEAVRKVLPRCVFDEERCAHGLTALESYRKEWNESLLTWHDRPLHDWASHGADSFRHGVTSLDKAPLIAAATRSVARPIVPVRWR
jgi:hypothetical protein